MEKLKVMADFGGVGVIPLLSAIVTSIPQFFPIILFFIWIFGTASAYFAMLNFTGRKRFFHALVGMSFAVYYVFSFSGNECNNNLFEWILGSILFSNDSNFFRIIR